MIVPRYAPGRWQAVVTDGHICLLPPEVDPDTVAALWTAVREGAGLTAQLQLLLAGGLDALPPFALVALERERVHVVVRGDVEVQVEGDEPRTVRGRRVSTWHEDVVDGATAVVVRVLDAGTATDARLPALSAVVPADLVAVDLRSGAGRSAPAAGTAVRAAAPVAPPAPVVQRAPEPVVAERAAEPVAAEQAPEPAVGPEPVVEPGSAPVAAAPEPAAPGPAVVPEPDAPLAPEPDAPLDPEPQPVVRRPAWAPVARDEQQAAGEAGASSSVGRQDHGAAASPPVRVAVAAAATTADGLEDLEHTVLHAATDTSVGLPLADIAGTSGSAVPGPAAVPAPEVLPAGTPAPAAPADDAPTPGASSPGAAEHDADHDGTTVLSSDVVALRRQLPDWAGDGVPGPLAVPAADRPAPAKIRLSSGLVVSLTRPVLLGRAPQVSRVSNRQMPRLVTVASPRQDISRTHAEVRMDGDDVLVTDLRSTNGVLLLRQGHGPQRLHPGEPTVVEPGVSVDLGEGVTFVVEPGA